MLKEVDSSHSCCGNGALSDGVFFFNRYDFVAIKTGILVMALTGWQGGRRQGLWWAVIGLCNKIFFLLLFTCVCMVLYFHS